MKQLRIVLALLLVLSFSAAEAVNHKKKKSVQKVKSNLGTSYVFEDGVVHGKYQYADESVSTVENEKVLNSLLGVRRDFRDRLQEETARK
jgi:hypothetical protein